MKMTCALFACAVAAAVLLRAAPAAAIERNFAGSAQLDYHFVPTAHQAKAFPNAFDGFTMEFAGKLAEQLQTALSHPHARFAPQQTGNDAGRARARPIADRTFVQQNNGTVLPAGQMISGAKADHPSTDDDHRHRFRDCTRFVLIGACW